MDTSETSKVNIPKTKYKLIIVPHIPSYESKDTWQLTKWKYYEKSLQLNTMGPV